MNCWLCDEEMTTYTTDQIWCRKCDVIYTFGNTTGVIYGFDTLVANAMNIPYVLFKNKRYHMQEWEHMLKLKAFW